jgi:uncharacterized membrane protein
MNIRAALMNRWDVVRNSYWFLPGLMAAGAVLLSLGTLHADALLAGGGLGDAWWVYTGSAEGARSVLQTIATSMIGVAGVVFSITTVTLTLAANKFGPRIFRNFMRDTGNQVVLGTFTATFLFCLLILRQVRGSDNDHDQFIPQLSMLTAVALAVFGLGVLIYFIHHVASSIQTANVVAAVGGDLLGQIRDLYPQQIGRGPADGAAEEVGLAAQVPPRFDAEAVPVPAPAGGYLRRVEADDLVRVAAAHDLLVRVDRQPGDFVAAGDTVLRVWPPDRAAEAVCESLRQALVIGDQRTPAQDVRFPLGQLVEIACLALSSGVNDLFTAIMCVDRIGEGIAFLARRAIPSAFRADDSGRLRVVAPRPDLPALLATAFDPIRHNGRDQPLVPTRVLEALARVAAAARRSGDKDAVLAQAELARDQAIAAGAAGPDRLRLDEMFAEVRRAAAGASPPRITPRAGGGASAGHRSNGPG